MTYFNIDKGSINKVRKMDIIDDDNVKMANKIVHKSMYSITF